MVSFPCVTLLPFCLFSYCHLCLFFSVFSENVVRLKSSAIGASLSSDLSPILHAKAMLSSELGAVILSVITLHFAGFFVG